MESDILSWYTGHCHFYADVHEANQWWCETNANKKLGMDARASVKRLRYSDPRSF